MEPVIHTILGVKLAHLVAGFFGGLVRAIVQPKPSMPYIMGSTIVGALSAGYLSPIAIPLVRSYLGPIEDGVGGSISFLLGLCGIALAEGLVQLAKKWRDDPRLPNWPKRP